MKFKFELSKMPTTQQQKGISIRNGKPKFYNRGRTSNYELKHHLAEAKPTKGFSKGIPLRLSVVYGYSIKEKKKWWDFKTTSPDLDNLMKNLQDYMTKLGYYADDRQIAVLHAEKYYCERNFIEIEIEELKAIKLEDWK